MLRPSADGGAGSEFAGIGAMLAGTPKGTTIGGLIKGGPAERAGLQEGDLIERIDGVSTRDLTLSDCVQRLRGPEGTRVTVAVSREEGQVIEVMIERAMIER
jgi:C-terminal processing protease CtpA/Prc